MHTRTTTLNAFCSIYYKYYNFSIKNGEKEMLFYIFKLHLNYILRKSKCLQNTVNQMIEKGKV